MTATTTGTPPTTSPGTSTPGTSAPPSSTPSTSTPTTPTTATTVTAPPAATISATRLPPTAGKAPRPVPARDVLGVVCFDCPEQCWVSEQPMPVGVWAREHTRRNPTHRQYQVAPQAPRPSVSGNARPPRPANRAARADPAPAHADRPAAGDRPGAGSAASPALGVHALRRPGRDRVRGGAAPGAPAGPRSALGHPVGLGVAVVEPLPRWARPVSAGSGVVALGRFVRWGFLSLCVVGWGLGLGTLLPVGSH